MKITAEMLRNAADDVMAETIAIRRHLHRNPELSGKEMKTAGFVAEQCRMVGCDVREHVGGYGLLARLLPDKAGETIVLRADMDALPIQDGKQCDYASSVDGISHSCGHDAHTAMLLGTMMLLSRLPVELPYNVAALFQPAEEITEGATAMLRDGVLEGLDAQRIYALHVYPYLPSGAIGLKSGTMCAAADMFEVEITGRGGHAARPHECVDVILIASHIIQALHHIISRIVDPVHPAVLTISQIEAGHAANVIPDRVRFTGTVRSLNVEAHEEIRVRMDHIIRQTAETWGATATFHIHHATSALKNNPDIIEEVRRNISMLSPGTNIIDIDQPSMGGEDFAEFLQHVPGCLMRLGTGSGPSTRYSLHHPCFDIDEESMRSGIMTLAALATSSIERKGL
ncbi:MAG: amidohydrolase [Mariprofundaceae bacterium]|nr:amidohydrolase [Mariprofundaceae bacterium]